MLVWEDDVQEHTETSARRGTAVARVRVPVNVCSARDHVNPITFEHLLLRPHLRWRR